METAAADGPTISRRELLGGAAGLTLASTSGCIQRIRSILNRDSPSAVSLSVTAPPADSDRMATLLARHLVENLEAVGINATLNVLPETELYREVLLNGNFDLFIAQIPPMDDPQALYGLLHSVYATEPGWQNPYRYASLSLDDALERQRATAGTQRREAVGEALELLCREQPFTTVAFPDEIRAARTDNFTGWERYPLQNPLSYLTLDRATGVSASEELVLRLGSADARMSQNLNPLSAEYRRMNPVTDLLYDPPVRLIEGEFVPWLASEYSWDSGRLRVSLRPGQRWHDGTSLTASDVAFTYQFLADTSLGTVAQTVPAPRFRAWSDLVSDAYAVDDTTVELSMVETSREVGVHALTVPVFPEHIWREMSDVADIQGIEGSDNITNAIVSSNIEAVGSGPLTVEQVTTDESVVLRPFNDHFLQRGAGILEEIPDAFIGEPAFDRVEFTVVPSNEAAVSLVADGEIDATATSVDPRGAVIERIISASGVSQFTEQSHSPYQIGYNTGVAPFSNPYFRRLVARLVDKNYVADEIFEGYGRPVAHPFDGTRWNPEELSFDGEDPVVPFIGSGGDVDVEAARAAFRERGFAFDENDTLILR
ncbi:ABC transporter substrate-binding protein [Halovenus sp. WSH3]|uniref:ABC transporter substrate-binding protein n=1 Tax=Halovenus carboxidivorans TaxID=2692199 RepID=A0A6B0TBI9_9EURY|nr:ABC transporter substrate-binding protein [Halovenus carboxidivorans]MXR52742.1 ABC transporter substrate-binding protein [Halovenus carboxidivorans]